MARRPLSVRDDLAGRPFGLLTALRRGVPISKTEVTWVCHCGGCGREVTVRLASLAAGAERCGACARRASSERARAGLWRHRKPRAGRRKPTRTRAEALALRRRVRELKAQGYATAAIADEVGVTLGRVQQILRSGPEEGG